MENRERMQFCTKYKDLKNCRFTELSSGMFVHGSTVLSQNFLLVMSNAKAHF